MAEAESVTMAEINTALKLLNAGADLTTARIHTLDIELPGGEHVRLALGYENLSLGVDGVAQWFEACQLDLALPNRDTSGNQTLRFSLDLNDGRANRLIRDALESGEPASVVYREYLSIDTSAPAKAPQRMLILGGDLNNNAMQIEGSYYDLLNLLLTRDRFTAAAAPGVKYQ